jgi:hypothetical protein
MNVNDSIDEMIRTVQTLDRERCMDQLRQMHRPKIDFTDEFLEGMSLDRLRHVVMAAFLQSKKSARRS